MNPLEAIGRVIAVFVSFAALHSLLATGYIKKAAIRVIGETFVKAFYRLIYTLISTVTTILAVYLIAKIPDQAIFIPPFWLRALMHFIQLAAFVFGAMSFVAVEPFEFVGMRQTLRYLSKRLTSGDSEGITGTVLVTSGVYNIVRHPLYLAGIILFSFNPYISRTWLTVSLLADAYFVMGAFIEERRLIARFGDEYRAYMKRVPRFVPGIRNREKKLA